MKLNSLKHSLFFFAFILLSTPQCSNDTSSRDNLKDYIIENNSKFQSTTAGNLIATAIKEVHDLDFVLYPKDLVREDIYTLYRPQMNEFERQELLNMYPIGTKDQFRVGSMKGSSLKSFIFDRIHEKYEAELEVAGLHYSASFIGGVLSSYNIAQSNGTPIQDNKIYTVAISNFYYFGHGFPFYKYRNSIGFKFRERRTLISAQDSLKKYLDGPWKVYHLDRPKARVNIIEKNQNLGEVPISTIQGRTHRSPYYGAKATTVGVVTAIGLNRWYPGGIEAYIQSLEPDNDLTTSEGLQVYLPETTRPKNKPASPKDNFCQRKTGYFEVGDVVKVTGTVYERATNSGLSLTSLRDVTHIELVKPVTLQKVKRSDLIIHKDDPKAAEKRKNQKPRFTCQPTQLPSPVILGQKGRSIPQHHFSRWVGDLNFKPNLDLNDGLDFYESLEGMLVAVHNPKVIGFIGGQQDHPSFLQKTNKPYITLHILPDGKTQHSLTSSGQGLIADVKNHDFNPEIITLTNNHLAPSLLHSREVYSTPVFKVGDLLPVHSDPQKTPQMLTGILGYEKNLFGDGDYTLIPDRIDWDFVRSKQTTNIVPLNKREKSRFTPSESQLTVATLNVENLSGSEVKRIGLFGEMIANNLNCPDILVLVEIQDDNGVDFSGGSSAAGTLKGLLDAIEIHQANAPSCLSSYRSLNVDPINNSEGGQPGGNIRIAFLYNANKLNFNSIPVPSPTTETLILPNGHLNYNPGRINVNSPHFRRTRRSLISELSFKGHQFFILGNHFNSKLGDSSHRSAKHPVVFKSEKRRRKIAEGVNLIVQDIKRYAPQAHVIVAGDFNAYSEEPSMKILAGNLLVNLTAEESIISQKDNYTHIHAGNSMAIDFIFSSLNLFQNHSPECEVLHINTNYMGRLSDHDPVICQFSGF